MSNKKQFFCYKPLKNLEHLSQLQHYLKQNVWFTRLDEFNDPFEACFKFQQDPQDVLRNQETFNHYLKYYQNNVAPGLTAEEFRRHFISPEFNHELKIQNQKYINTVFPGHGAICLMDQDDSLSM